MSLSDWNRLYLKNGQVFRCAEYVLEKNPHTKLKSRATERVYRHTLEHGVYEVLVPDEDDIPRI